MRTSYVSRCLQGSRALLSCLAETKEWLAVGQEVTGTVKKYTEAGAYIDVGEGTVAFLETGEFKDGFVVDGLGCKKRDNITARVLDLHEGRLYLTKRSGSLERPSRYRGKIHNVAAFKGLRPDTWFDGEVQGMNSNGLYLAIEHPSGGKVVGFLHKSEFLDDIVDDPTKTVRGGKLRVRLLRVGTVANKLKFTMYGRSSVKPGDEIQCTVTRVKTNLGVFVDLGDRLVGLIEAHELRDGFPRGGRQLRKGENVTARVLDVSGGKLFLTLRSGSLERPPRMRIDPMDVSAFAKLPADTWLDGEVYAFTTFSAFIKVASPTDGVPVLGVAPKEEFSEGFVDDADKAVRGGKVKVRVLEVKVDAKRMRLSMLPLP